MQEVRAQGHRHHDRHARGSVIRCVDTRILLAPQSVCSYPLIPDTQWEANVSSRVLVSQDKMQLFITFARTPAEWLVFLKRNRTSTPRSFMRLYRFGRWDLTWANEVREAAAILLAIAK
jgi:hypothetical protein